MKRKTVLKGNGRAGEIKITIESVSKNGDLMRDEHESRHESLIEKVHGAMSESGCYAHRIKVV